MNVTEFPTIPKPCCLFIAHGTASYTQKEYKDRS
jgi:hypothetical protein